MSEIIKPMFLDETGKRVATALESLVDKLGTHKITVLAVANDGGEITEQLLKIYNLDTGVLYGEVTVSSTQSASFEVPKDFSYQIVPQNTMTTYYITDKPSGIATSDKTITLTWKTLGSLSTFPDLKAILNTGLGKYVAIGTEVSFNHATLGNIPYEVVDFDSESESFTLLQKNILEAQKELDSSEALLKATSEMSAGNYTFKNGSTSYYFTLTKALPSGGQIRATTSAFYTYKTQYDTSYDETGTVSTTALSDCTDLGTCASGVLNHFDRVQYGSSDYGECALDQWLNASGYDWWTAKTMFDRPPSYVGQAGFLTGVPNDVLEVIDTTEVKCVAQTTYCAPDSSHTKGAKYTLNRKFYLASEKEIFGSASFDDGSKIFNLYIGATATDRIKRWGTSARYWWLRSPYSVYYERFVNSSGSVHISSASTSYGVVSACRISKS